MKKYLLIFMVFCLLACGQSGGETDMPIIPPIVVSTWSPPATKGLHLLIDLNNKKEIFSVIRIPTGLMIGEYGLLEGGPQILTWDGQAFQLENHIVNAESVFDFYALDDGKILATNEHHKQIHKRYGPQNWLQKYGSDNWTDLVFYIRKAGNSLYANFSVWEYYIQSGGLLRSDDEGETWQEIARYDKFLPGLISDGSNIYLVGCVGRLGLDESYPVLTDISGNVISSRPDHTTLTYWGGCKFKGLFVLGTSNENSQDRHSGYIDVYDGTKNVTVFASDRNVIYKIEEYNGNLYAVLTWEWEADRNKTSLLVTSSDGYNWSVLCEIPCPHIIGTRIDDGIIYLSGGRYRDFGQVWCVVL